MPDPNIAALRRSAELLAALPDPAAAAIAAALRRYEAEAPFGMTLDRALGLAPAPGKTPWWQAEASERRNAALRAIRDQHFANLGNTQAAREIATMGRRFLASAGRRDRLPSEAKLLLETVARSGGFPGPRRIMDILRSE